MGRLSMKLTRKQLHDIIHRMFAGQNIVVVVQNYKNAQEIISEILIDSTAKMTNYIVNRSGPSIHDSAGSVFFCVISRDIDKIRGMTFNHCVLLCDVDGHIQDIIKSRVRRK